MLDHTKFVVLGAGRQGTAAAYDIAFWGQAGQVVLADSQQEAAHKSAERVNRLAGRPVAEAVQVDVTDPQALDAVLRGAGVALSAVPYVYNLEITRAALRAGVSLCDLGGNTDIAREQHGFDAEARAAGISIIPNCGQVPGMGTSLAVYAMQLLDEAVDIYMWDGGLPQQPRPPFNYLLTFHIGGLTNEYAEPAVFLRDWKVTVVDPMTEVEELEFPEPIGRLEAFVMQKDSALVSVMGIWEITFRANRFARQDSKFMEMFILAALLYWILTLISTWLQERLERRLAHAYER